MKTVNETIAKVAASPNKKITTVEAQAILRNCGIFNKDNRIKSAYKNIIVKPNEVTGGRK